MKCRKLFAFCLVMLLIFTSMTQAYAQSMESKQIALTSEEEKKVKVSQDEAKQTALKALKDYFDITIDETKFESRVELVPNYEARNSYTWFFSWYLNNSESNLNLSVSINATSGKITSFSKNEYKNKLQQPQVAKYTYEQAKKLAEEFINRVNPEIQKNIKFMEDYYKNYYSGYSMLNYNFRYARIINGIEYQNNGINVCIDGSTGKVISYSCQWDEDINPPGTDGIIDKDKALEEIKKEISMKMAYIPYRDPQYYDEKPQSILLIYNSMFGNGNMLDAKTGKLLTFGGEKISTVDLNDSQREDFYNKYTPVKKFDKDIDKDKAEELLNKLVKEILGENYSIEYLRYVQSTNYWETRGKTAWSGQIKNSETGAYQGGQITIDASTGQLINLYRDYFYDGKPETFIPKISWDEAYTKSIDIIGRYFTDKVKNITTTQSKYENAYIVNGIKSTEPQYYFGFQRTANGVPYNENSISIEFDTKSGEILRVTCNWDDNINFPDIKNAMSKEEATEIFFENNAVSLSYITVNKNMDYTNPEMETKLVYMLKPKNGSYMYMTGNIDAITGKLIDYNGKEIGDSQNSFKEKIKGNPHEKELSILAFQGIIDDKTFDPNKQATKLDMIRMLVNAKGYRPYSIKDSEDLKFTDIKKEDENYKTIQMAVKYGLIKNEAAAFKGDQKITREELAQMLVSLTSYSKLGNVKGIFALNFSDAKTISPDKYGYVAIAKGLSIMDGIKSAFRPKDNVTMTDLAASLYNTLPHILLQY